MVYNEKKCNCLLLLFLLLFYKPLHPNDTTKAEIKKLFIKSAIIYTTVNTYLYFSWYKNQNLTCFHLYNDLNEWYQIDKVGHSFTSFWINDYLYKNLSKKHQQKTKILLYSSLLSFFLISTIEIYDAFGEGWGFSCYDIIANFTGNCLYFINNLYLKNTINLKFSYHFTEYYKYNKRLLGSNYAERIIKDYNGQTYWLSIDFSKVISGFPSYLNVSFGYSIDGLIRAKKKDYTIIDLQKFNPQRQYFLSLDINPRKIKVNNKVLKYFLSVFNIIKFPFPALELKSNKILINYIYF